MKGVSGLAYDPHGQALFYLSQGASGSNQCPVIMCQPDQVEFNGAAWEHLNLVHITTQEEMKSKDKEEAPAVSG
jgi:hypothetical protein